MPRNRKTPQPLNALKLREIAFHYVGRYATSRAKLAAYLNRKLRERGWEDASEGADIQAVVDDCVRLGFVDDASFAAARARTLTLRGMGDRRVREDLHAKGITADDATDAFQQVSDDKWRSADRYARRKRIGPYSSDVASPELQQKQLQAFARAGHSFETAKRFVFAEPGAALDLDD